MKNRRSITLASFLAGAVLTLGACKDSEDYHCIRYNVDGRIYKVDVSQGKKARSVNINDFGNGYIDAMDSDGDGSFDIIRVNVPRESPTRSLVSDVELEKAYQFALNRGRETQKK